MSRKIHLWKDYEGVRSPMFEIQIHDQLQDKCRQAYGALPDLGFLYSSEKLSDNPLKWRVHLRGKFSGLKILANPRYRVACEKTGRTVEEKELEVIKHAHPIEKAMAYKEEFFHVDEFNSRYIRKYIVQPRIANAMPVYRKLKNRVADRYPYTIIPGLKLDEYMEWLYTRLSNPEME